MLDVYSDFKKEKNQTNPALQWFRKIHRWWSGATKSQAKPTQAEMTFLNSTALILLLGKSAWTFVSQPDTTISFLHIWFPTWLLWYHKKTSLKTQWAIYDSFFMKTHCSSETDHPWIFLGQEAKRREDDSLFKFAQKFRRNVPIVTDTFFWSIAHRILNPLAHAVEIKEHSWNPPRYQWACNKLRGSKAFLFSIMSVVKLRIQRNLKLQGKHFPLID